MGDDVKVGDGVDVLLNGVATRKVLPPSFRGDGHVKIGLSVVNT